MRTGEKLTFGMLLATRDATASSSALLRSMHSGEYCLEVYHDHACTVYIQMDTLYSLVKRLPCIYVATTTYNKEVDTSSPSSSCDDKTGLLWMMEDVPAVTARYEVYNSQ